MLIELRAVHKRYCVGRETITVLDNINLTIRPGESIALIGPSGSGKTTLSQIIGGLERPDAGEVLVEGKKLNKKSDRALSLYRNRHVGFVLQQFSLLPDYTALENVAVPLMLSRVRLRERNRLAAAFLRLVGLERQAKQYAHELSGGQRQRVSIARALVTNPSLIIADEPTGSLDPQRGEEIAALLQALNQQRGVTLLLVTHNNELAKRAQRILTIRNAQLQEVPGALL